MRPTGGFSASVGTVTSARNVFLMVSGMVEGSAGKFQRFQRDYPYRFSFLTETRSLRQFNGWNEEVIFKSDMARDLKTVDLKKNPTLRMSVMPKRKVQLSKISDWLATGSTLDETVIEALSK